MNDKNLNQGIVLGQKYAYATAALLVGIASYIQLLGIERALLAIIFAWLALRKTPEPHLDNRRLWAKVGLALEVVMLILVPTIVAFKFETLQELMIALENLQ